MVKFECKMSVRVFPLRKKYRELEFCSYTLILDTIFLRYTPKNYSNGQIIIRNSLKAPTSCYGIHPLHRWQFLEPRKYIGKWTIVPVCRQLMPHRVQSVR